MSEVTTSAAAASSATAPSAEPRSATTGEPVSTTARRNRLGIWMCIVSDATGTIALLVAYSYLWSLNVNRAWAPPNDAWADTLPFWLIVFGVILAAATMWWGVRGIAAGNRGRLIAASGMATLIALVTFVGQIVQLSTFPFAISDGAYASATFWLAIATALHLSLVLFLTMSIMNRTRAGILTKDNHSHARLVAMWMTWVCVAAFVGALFATTMTVSPNTNSPTFGTFSE
jgi:heme/copper-type cytochrome/quinol oxidase subunit 3